jgi:hypothetical protein
MARFDHRRRLCFGHSKARRQVGHGPGGGIPQRAQRRPQHDQEDMKPLMRFALAHPEQPPLHHWEGRGLQVDQDAQEPILGRGQRAVLVGGIPTGGPGLPIAAPLGHMSLKCRLKREDHVLKRLDGKTGQIEHLCRAGVDVGEP